MLSNRERELSNMPHVCGAGYRVVCTRAEGVRHQPRRMLAESQPLTYSLCMTAAPQLDMTNLPPFVSAVEGRLMMALKFFELGRLSLGQAAEVAGYSKRAFIDVLGQYGIPVADYPASELANEVAW